MKKNLKKQLKKMFENGEGKFYPKFVINNDWRQEDYIMCCFNLCGMEVIHAIIHEGYFIRDANYFNIYDNGVDCFCYCNDGWYEDIRNFEIEDYENADWFYDIIKKYYKGLSYEEMYDLYDKDELSKECKTELIKERMEAYYEAEDGSCYEDLYGYFADRLLAQYDEDYIEFMINEANKNTANKKIKKIA